MGRNVQDSESTMWKVYREDQKHTWNFKEMKD
jgi:hypothetical protein